MTENIYQRGQIYTIRSHQTELIYIGSTVQPLHVRFAQHKLPSNYCSSMEIIKFGDSYIELLELFPCNSKAELNRQEGIRIRESACVNIHYSLHNPIEFMNKFREQGKARAKKYYNLNREKILSKNKEKRELDLAKTL